MYKYRHGPYVLLLCPVGVATKMNYEGRVSGRLFRGNLGSILRKCKLRPARLGRLTSVSLGGRRPTVLTCTRGCGMPFTACPTRRLRGVARMSTASQFIGRIANISGIYRETMQATSTSKRLLYPGYVETRVAITLARARMALRFWGREGFRRIRRGIFLLCGR